METMQIIAAADGSSLGNPGPAGWAWFVDADTWRAGGWPRGTNNQGELMAVIDLLEATAHLDVELRILCDSQYVINCVTKWMPGWKRKGWKKADGKPVQNRDLLERIDAALPGRKVEFEWVRGHAGHELNEAADTRARAVAEAFQRGAEPDAGPGLGAIGAAGGVETSSVRADSSGAAAPSGPASSAESSAAKRSDRTVVDDADPGAVDSSAAKRSDRILVDDADPGADALFGDELFLPDDVDGPSDSNAETLAALIGYELDDPLSRRDDDYTSRGTASTAEGRDASARLLSPDVALVTSTAAGVDRTSVWVRRTDRHQAEWRLAHRHEG